MMRKSFVLFFILLCVLLTACNPQKRVARIVKKYNLPAVTEYVSDTVVIPSRVRTDTVIMHGEPIIINDTAFITELVPVDDTMYIVRTTIKPDTIIKNVPVKKYVVKDKISKMDFSEILKTVSFIVGYLVLVLLLFKLCRK